MVLGALVDFVVYKPNAKQENRGKTVIDKTSSHVSDETLAAICKQALVSEADAILNFSERLGDEFAKSLRLIEQSTGPLVVVGIGKSGHIARKISSSFSSIGKLSLFLHAAEANHGDLGQIRDDSVVLLISNSGETPELFQTMRFCLDHQVPMIALTSDPNSTLGTSADVVIAYGKLVEVCPNGLAPTTTTTLSLAIGDALVVGLTNLLGSQPDDFRKFHPGGNLGTKLLKVKDLMHQGEALPIVAPHTPMSEVIITMTEKSLGMAIVVENNRIIGVISDGDLRRNAKEIWDLTAKQVCSFHPVTITDDLYASKALEIMSNRPKPITCCVVSDNNNRPIGALHVHDCLRAGVIS